MNKERQNFAEVRNAGVSDNAYIISGSSIESYSEYDSYGNVVKETDVMEQVTAYNYDEKGNLTSYDIAGDGTLDLVASYTM